MSELPVLFEDVRIVAAVPVAPGLPAKLSVTLDASHRFQAGRPPTKTDKCQTMRMQQDALCQHILRAH